MEIFMKVNGKRIKLMDMESTFIQMERDIKDIGRKIIKMVVVFKNGQIIVNTKDNIKLERRMVKDFMYGLMEVPIKEVGLIIN
jgi:hypothetical protein